MGADPPALGKGLFGYRKSAVNQMLSDRDIMLRQAEGRPAGGRCGPAPPPARTAR